MPTKLQNKTQVFDKIRVSIILTTMLIEIKLMLKLYSQGKKVEIVLYYNRSYYISGEQII